MIKAVDDKIVVQTLKRTKTSGGIILPSAAQDPQSYGRVMSVGENVPNIKPDYVICYHNRAGMDFMVKGLILKVVKYGEIYGIITDEEIINSLDNLTVN